MGMNENMELAKVGQKQKSIYMVSDICPICNGTGLELYQDEDGRPYTRTCKCGIRNRIIRQERFTFARIPDSFKDLRLDNYRIDIYDEPKSKIIVQKNLKAAEWWLKNFDSMRESGKGLYLYSAIKGCGKTRFAISIANELIASKSCSVKFVTSIHIINEIKATWNKEYEYTEQQLLEELTRVDVLIIDDFDVEAPKDWIEERFYQIINERYMKNLITIYTSNMAVQNTSYDERIKNRIIEKSYQLLFPNESIRELISKNNQAELKEAIA